MVSERREARQFRESDYRRAARALVWLGPALMAYNGGFAYLILQYPMAEWRHLLGKGATFLVINLSTHATYSLLNAALLFRSSHSLRVYRLFAALSGCLLGVTCGVSLWLHGSAHVGSVLLTLLTVAVFRVYYDWVIAAVVAGFAMLAHAVVVMLEASSTGFALSQLGPALSSAALYPLVWLSASLVARRVMPAGEVSEPGEHARTWPSLPFARTGPAASSTEAHQVGPRPGSVVLDKYHLDTIIGSGGMGTVFSARHLHTGKRCALKWLNVSRGDSASRARFAQEAQAAGRVHHPNVVDLYDVGEHEGASFLVMELLEGMSLRERLEAGPLSVRDALDVVAQAARGVAAAHAAGVLHRDLKPENLFLTLGARQQRLVKVLDFGISKLTHAGHELVVTRSDVLVGTPLYMAPERLFNEPSDERADLYSLGVILYECLTGRVPFPADNAAALGRLHTLAQGLTMPSALRSEVPELVDELVAHALARQVTDRPRSASSFADAIEQTLELLPELGHEAADSEPSPANGASIESGTRRRDVDAAQARTKESRASRIAQAVKQLRKR